MYVKRQMRMDNLSGVVSFSSTQSNIQLYNLYILTKFIRMEYRNKCNNTSYERHSCSFVNRITEKSEMKQIYFNGRLLENNYQTKTKIMTRQ